VQLPGVELVELPFHANPWAAHILRLKPDDLTPTHAGVAHEHHGDELVIATGQQRRPLSNQEDAQRVGRGLLRPTMM
jgi:hypothetical protein